MMSCKVPVPFTPEGTPAPRRKHDWQKTPNMMPVYVANTSRDISHYVLIYHCLDCHARFGQEVYSPRPGAQPKEVAM